MEILQGSAYGPWNGLQMNLKEEYTHATLNTLIKNVLIPIFIQSNKTSSSVYLLGRSHSARITLEKACAFCPEEVKKKSHQWTANRNGRKFFIGHVSVQRICVAVCWF